MGDETRLAQVVDNLLNNATKFTDHGGQVHLHVSQDDSQAWLCVSDNGMGMPADLLASAFDPFVQGPHTLARSEGGLGIGLALVKRIVELHEGQVQAHSAGPGSGSRFDVVLPLSHLPAPTSSPHASHDTAQVRPSAALRVLVVDDNRDAAESLATLLELEGFEVRTVHDGLEALAAAAAWRPHGVVLDIGLPGMNGHQVATALRARWDPTSMRLIALTGYGQPSDRERARSAGFDQHLVKPVDHNELVAALRAEGQPQFEATWSQR